MSEQEVEPTKETPPAAKRRPGRPKKKKVDELLGAVRQVVDSLGDAGVQATLANTMVRELKLLTEITQTGVPGWSGVLRATEVVNNIYDYIVNTNGYVRALHAEMVKLNETTAAVEKALSSIPHTAAGLVSGMNQILTSLSSLQSTIAEKNPPPGAYPPQHVQPGFAPPPSGYVPPPGFAPPLSPPGAIPTPPEESVVSMLADITDKEAYKVARDLGLFERYSEDEFLRTNGLKQAQWIADKLPPTAIHIIRARVTEYRKFRNGGYKNRKV